MIELHFSEQFANTRRTCVTGSVCVPLVKHNTDQNSATQFFSLVFIYSPKKEMPMKRDAEKRKRERIHYTHFYNDLKSCERTRPILLIRFWADKINYLLLKTVYRYKSHLDTALVVHTHFVLALVDSCCCYFLFVFFVHVARSSLSAWVLKNVIFW